MPTKTKEDLPHLLAKTITATNALDEHRRKIVREINHRTRALRQAADAIATHDLAGDEQLPLEGADALSPNLLALIDRPTEGLESAALEI